MKKLFLSLVLALGIVSAAHSATGYNLYIGTTEVTSSNQSDVLGDGTVSYDPTAHTLTLQNANLTLSESLRVYAKHGDLIISVKGKNTINVINTDSYATIVTECGLSIVGATKNAQLTLKGNSGIGASTRYNSPLNIHIGGGTYPLTLNIDAIRYGIYIYSYGSSGSGIANLVINKNTTVNISATTDGAISCYGGSITLASGIGITQPVGAHISNGRIFDPQNQYVTSAVCIEPVTEYDLWVAGTQVHSGNQGNILCDKSASATYNPTTNTLTLDNANISSSSHAIIQNNIAGLKINISRGCFLISKSSSLPVILCTANTTITSSVGNASLGIYQQTKEYDAVVNDGCKLAIDGGDFGLYVNIIGHSGIHGKNSGAEFSIKNAHLVINQSVNGAIHGQSSINLNDCAITQPTVAQIYNGAIVDKNNNVVCEEVDIRKVEKYPLYVAGIQVNKVNCGNITGDGKVIYYPSSKTLTLKDGANISCSTKSPIFSGVDGLTLLCEGKVTLSYTGTSASEHGLYVTGSTTIRSYGSLTINSPNAAIYSTECTTTIQGITLTLNGKKYGFRGMPSGEFSSNLEIVRADVNIAATTNGAISNISSLTLTDIEIMEPAKCSFSASKMGLVDASNTIVTSAVMMETVVKYGVYVKGVQVTSKNCSDILGDGKVTYVDNNNTLTLTNANIVYNGTEVIAAYQDLTINCIGENTVYCTNTTNGSAIGNDVGKTTITGSGTLLAKSDALSAIYGEYDLTISDGCKVTAQSAKGSAVSVAGEPLTIDNATLIAKGNGKEATINGCANLVLNNAEITSGHTYDATLHKFLTAGGEEATDDIIIGVEGTGLEQLTVDNARCTMRKMILDNQLYILRGNKIYNAAGSPIHQLTK